MDAWRKETGIGFTLYATPIESIGHRFANIDREEFGMVKDVTDKGYYTNSYHLDYREEIDSIKKMKIEGEYQSITNGGGISYIKLPDSNPETVENLIKNAYDTIMYIEFVKDYSLDNLFDLDKEKEQ